MKEYYKKRNISSSGYSGHVIKPDMTFSRQLKALRSTLEAVWNPCQQLWEIWEFPKDDEPYMVTSVAHYDRTGAKSYKALSAEILLSIQKNMQLSPTEIVKYLEIKEAEVRRAKTKAIEDKVHDITSDSLNYIMGIPTFQVPRQFKIAEVCHA